MISVLKHLSLVFRPEKGVREQVNSEHLTKANILGKCRINGNSGISGGLTWVLT